MNYNTVYVGMDVHKETFSLCCYTNEKELAEYSQKVDAHYSKVLNYLEPGYKSKALKARQKGNPADQFFVHLHQVL